MEPASRCNRRKLGRIPPRHRESSCVRPLRRDFQGKNVSEEGAIPRTGTRNSEDKRGEKFSSFRLKPGGDTGKTRRFVLPPPPPSSSPSRWNKFALLLNLHYLRYEDEEDKKDSWGGKGREEGVEIFLAENTMDVSRGM